MSKTISKHIKDLDKCTYEPLTKEGLLVSKDDKPPQQMRYGSYAIIDIVPNFWIQHGTNGFICAIPYKLENEVLKTKALAMAQKICTALDQYDKDTSKN